MTDEYPGAESYVLQHLGWREDCLVDKLYEADEFASALVNLFIDEYNPTSEEIARESNAIREYCERHNL